MTKADTPARQDTKTRAVQRAKRLKRYRRGHRLIGLPIALFLIVMAVTGILLNHMEELGLDQSNVPALLASRYYQAPDDLTGFQTGDNWYYSLEGQLLLNGAQLTQCSQLAGVVEVELGLVAACDTSLLLLDDSGLLIEAITLPESILMVGPRSVGLTDTSIVMLAMSSGVFRFSLESLEQIVVDNPKNIRWSLSKPIPVAVLESASGFDISWQKLVLDLHSGRYFGQWGVWFQDLVALLLIVMAVTGIKLWFGPRSAN